MYSIYTYMCDIYTENLIINRRSSKISAEFVTWSHPLMPYLPLLRSHFLTFRMGTHLILRILSHLGSEADL